MKLDASHDIVTVEPCELTDTICMVWSSTERSFFFFYSCLFADLHVSLSFDNVMMGVLQALNVVLIYPDKYIKSTII